MSPGSRAAAAWRRWEQHPVWRGWTRARELSLVTHALALAAQQVLCTAPLMVALSALLRRAGGEGPGVLVPRYLGLTGASAKDVAALFAGASPRVSFDNLAVGALLAFAFGTGVALTLQRGCELIWDVPRAGVRSFPRQCLWLFGLVAYLVVILSVGRNAHHIHGHDHVRLGARVVVQFGASFVFFWWSQRLLLGGRVSWRALWPGALAIAVGTAGLVALSGLVLPGQITDEVSDYGLVGGAFVLSIWLVALSGVVLGGVMVGNVVHDAHRPVGEAQPSDSD